MNFRFFELDCTHLARLTVIVAGIWSSAGYAASRNELNSHTQQLQTELRMDQVRQDLNAQLNSSLASQSNPGVDFSPTLIGYRSMPRRPLAISPEQLSEYLKLLGDPLEETGIYSYPANKRLFYYGQMCIKLGLVEEGIRAISAYTRIQAEASSISQ